MSQPPPEYTELQPRIGFVGGRIAFCQWQDDEGSHHKKVDERVTVGSARENGLVVSERTVSRLHAELDPRPDGLWVRDLGSRNGTSIDHVPVQSARVPDGAALRLGSTILRVSYAALQTRQQLWPEERFGPLVGRSVSSRALFATLSRIAPLDTSVLVLGETGTGKELVARAIHEASKRAEGPFVIVDCAALPDTLLDAELFGHAKGAFTGAHAPRVGAIETAEGGTVFLDEVGELPMAMQPKLLRVLESRTIRRIGESIHRNVDVRFVAATHRDLSTMVNEGTFREDLFFRLSVVPIVVPPLRTRTDDIELLVSEFLPKKAQIAPELLRELTTMPWRGNVRELRNVIERIMALGPDEALRALREGVPSPLASEEAAASIAPPSTSGAGIDFEQGFKTFREQWVDKGEREYLRRLLERHGDNVSEAAAAAGVDRTYIYRLLRKHGR